MKHGYTREWITQHIGELIEEGHNQGVAAAIAYNEARRAYNAAHPGKPLPAHLQPRVKSNPAKRTRKVRIIRHRAKTIRIGAVFKISKGGRGAYREGWLKEGARGRLVFTTKQAEAKIYGSQEEADAHVAALRGVADPAYAFHVDVE